jgi:hypothetical protein
MARKVTLAITKPSDTRPFGTRIQLPRQSGLIRSRSFAYSYERAIWPDRNFSKCKGNSGPDRAS